MVRAKMAAGNSPRRQSVVKRKKNPPRELDGELLPLPGGRKRKKTALDGSKVRGLMGSSSPTGRKVQGARNAHRSSPQRAKMDSSKETPARKSSKSSLMGAGGKASQIAQKRTSSVAVAKESEVLSSRTKTKAESTGKRKAKPVTGNSAKTRTQRHKGRGGGDLEQVSSRAPSRRARLSSRQRLSRPRRNYGTTLKYSDSMMSVASDHRLERSEHIIGHVELDDMSRYVLAYQKSTSGIHGGTVSSTTAPNEQLHLKQERQEWPLLKMEVEPQVGEEALTRSERMVEEPWVEQQDDCSSSEEQNHMVARKCGQHLLVKLAWPQPQGQSEALRGKQMEPQLGAQSACHKRNIKRRDQFQSGEGVEPLLEKFSCFKFAEGEICGETCHIGGAHSGEARVRCRTGSLRLGKKRAQEARNCNLSSIDKRPSPKRLKPRGCRQPNAADKTKELLTLPEGQGSSLGTGVRVSNAGVSCVPLRAHRGDVLPTTARGDCTSHVQHDQTSSVNEYCRPSPKGKVSVLPCAQTNLAGTSLPALEGDLERWCTSSDGAVSATEEALAWNPPEEKNQLVTPDSNVHMPLTAVESKMNSVLHNWMIMLPNSDWNRADDSKLLATLEKATGLNLSPQVLVTDCADVRKKNLNFMEEASCSRYKYLKSGSNAKIDLLQLDNNFTPPFQPTYQVWPVMSNTPGRVVTLRSPAAERDGANTPPARRLGWSQAGQVREQTSVPLRPRGRSQPRGRFQQRGRPWRRAVASGNTEMDVSAMSGMSAPVHEASMVCLSGEVSQGCGQYDAVRNVPHVSDITGVKDNHAANWAHNMAKSEDSSSSLARVQAKCEADSVKSDDSADVPLISFGATVSAHRTVELRQVRVTESAGIVAEVAAPVRGRLSNRNVILATTKDGKTGSQDANRLSSSNKPGASALPRTTTSLTSHCKTSRAKKAARQAGCKEGSQGKTAVDFLNEIAGEESFEPDYMYEEAETEVEGSTSEGTEEEGETPQDATSRDIDTRFMVDKYLSSQDLEPVASAFEGPSNNGAEQCGIWSRLAPLNVQAHQESLASGGEPVVRLPRKVCDGMPEKWHPSHGPAALPETSQVSDSNMDQTATAAQKKQAEASESGPTEAQAEESMLSREADKPAAVGGVSRTADGGHTLNLNTGSVPRKRGWRQTSHHKKSSNVEGSKITLNRRRGPSNPVSPPAGSQSIGNPVPPPDGIQGPGCPVPPPDGSQGVGNPVPPPDGSQGVGNPVPPPDGSQGLDNPVLPLDGSKGLDNPTSPPDGSQGLGNPVLPSDGSQSLGNPVSPPDGSRDLCNAVSPPGGSQGLCSSVSPPDGSQGLGNPVSSQGGSEGLRLLQKAKKTAICRPESAKDTANAPVEETGDKDVSSTVEEALKGMRAGADAGRLEAEAPHRQDIGFRLGGEQQADIEHEQEAFLEPPPVSHTSVQLRENSCAADQSSSLDGSDSLARERTDPRSDVSSRLDTATKNGASVSVMRAPTLSVRRNAAPSTVTKAARGDHSEVGSSTTPKRKFACKGQDLKRVLKKLNLRMTVQEAVKCEQVIRELKLLQMKSQGKPDEGQCLDGLKATAVTEGNASGASAAELRASSDGTSSTPSALTTLAEAPSSCEAVQTQAKMHQGQATTTQALGSVRTAEKQRKPARSATSAAVPSSATGACSIVQTAQRVAEKDSYAKKSETAAPQTRTDPLLPQPSVTAVAGEKATAIPLVQSGCRPTQTTAGEETPNEKQAEALMQSAVTVTQSSSTLMAASTRENISSPQRRGTATKATGSEKASLGLLPSLQVVTKCRPVEATRKAVKTSTRSPLGSGQAGTAAAVVMPAPKPAAVTPSSSAGAETAHAKPCAKSTSCLSVSLSSKPKPSPDIVKMVAVTVREHATVVRATGSQPPVERLKVAVSSAGDATAAATGNFLPDSPSLALVTDCDKRLAANRASSVAAAKQLPGKGSLTAPLNAQQESTTELSTHAAKRSADVQDGLANVPAMLASGHSSITKDKCTRTEPDQPGSSQESKKQGSVGRKSLASCGEQDAAAMHELSDSRKVHDEDMSKPSPSGSNVEMVCARRSSGGVHCIAVPSTSPQTADAPGAVDPCMDTADARRTEQPRAGKTSSHPALVPLPQALRGPASKSRHSVVHGVEHARTVKMNRQSGTSQSSVGVSCRRLPASAPLGVQSKASASASFAANTGRREHPSNEKSCASRGAPRSRKIPEASTSPAVVAQRRSNTSQRRSSTGEKDGKDVSILLAPSTPRPPGGSTVHRIPRISDNKPGQTAAKSEGRARKASPLMLLETPPCKRVKSHLSSVRPSDDGGRDPSASHSLPRKRKKEKGREASTIVSVSSDCQSQDQTPDKQNTGCSSSVKSQERRPKSLSQKSVPRLEDPKESSGNSDGKVAPSAAGSSGVFPARRTNSRESSRSSDGKVTPDSFESSEVFPAGRNDSRECSESLDDKVTPDPVETSEVVPAKRTNSRESSANSDGKVAPSTGVSSEVFPARRTNSRESSANSDGKVAPSTGRGLEMFPARTTSSVESSVNLNVTDQGASKSNRQEPVASEMGSAYGGRDGRQADAAEPPVKSTSCTGTTLEADKSAGDSTEHQPQNLNSDESLSSDKECRSVQELQSSTRQKSDESRVEAVTATVRDSSDSTQLAAKPVPAAAAAAAGTGVESQLSSNKTEWSASHWSPPTVDSPEPCENPPQDSTALFGRIMSCEKAEDWTGLGKVYVEWVSQPASPTVPGLISRLIQAFAGRMKNNLAMADRFRMFVEAVSKCRQSLSAQQSTGVTALDKYNIRQMGVKLMEICFQKGHYDKCGCIMAAVEQARIGFVRHLAHLNLSPIDQIRLEVLKHVSRQDGKSALRVLQENHWLQERLLPEQRHVRTETLLRVASLLLLLVRDKKEGPDVMIQGMGPVLAALLALNSVSGKIDVLSRLFNDVFGLCLEHRWISALQQFHTLLVNYGSVVKPDLCLLQRYIYLLYSLTSQDPKYFNSAAYQAGLNITFNLFPAWELPSAVADQSPAARYNHGMLYFWQGMNQTDVLVVICGYLREVLVINFPAEDLETAESRDSIQDIESADLDSLCVEICIMEPPDEEVFGRLYGNRPSSDWNSLASMIKKVSGNLMPPLRVSEDVDHTESDFAIEPESLRQHLLALEWLLRREADGGYPCVHPSLLPEGSERYLERQSQVSHLVARKCQALSRPSQGGNSQPCSQPRRWVPSPIELSSSSDDMADVQQVPSKSGSSTVAPEGSSEMPKRAVHSGRGIRSGSPAAPSPPMRMPRSERERIGQVDCVVDPLPSDSRLLQGSPCLGGGAAGLMRQPQASHADEESGLMGAHDATGTAADTHCKAGRGFGPGPVPVLSVKRINDNMQQLPSKKQGSCFVDLTAEDDEQLAMARHPIDKKLITKKNLGPPSAEPYCPGRRSSPGDAKPGYLSEFPYGAGDGSRQSANRQRWSSIESSSISQMKGHFYQSGERSEPERSHRSRDDLTKDLQPPRHDSDLDLCEQDDMLGLETFPDENIFGLRPGQSSCHIDSQPSRATDSLGLGPEEPHKRSEVDTSLASSRRLNWQSGSGEALPFETSFPGQQHSRPPSSWQSPAKTLPIAQHVGNRSDLPQQPADLFVSGANQIDLTRQLGSQSASYSLWDGGPCMATPARGNEVTPALSSQVLPQSFEHRPWGHQFKVPDQSSLHVKEQIREGVWQRLTFHINRGTISSLQRDSLTCLIGNFFYDLHFREGGFVELTDELYEELLEEVDNKVRMFRPRT